MSKRDKPSGFDLKKAVALAQAGHCEEALPLAQALATGMKSSDGYRLLVHCLESLGRADELAQALEQGALAFPQDPELGARAALSLYERDRWAEAATAFQKLPRAVLDAEPELGARYAHALVATGRSAEALEPARRAFAHKPRGIPALVLGLALLDAGDLAGADEPLGRASQSLEGLERAFAEGLVGLDAFWRGELERATEVWRRLDARAELAPHLLSFLAVAEAMRGDGEAARALLARAPDPAAPTALLARARVELVLGHADAALEALAQIPTPPPEVAPLLDATRGRCLRLLGRHAEAQQVLAPVAELPGPVGAMARVDLGRIASDAGRHEDAAAWFERALAADPHSSEAQQGQAMARERIAWRDSLARDAQSQVAAARAEAEAMRRAFAERERELEMLRARLAQTQREATEAEKEAARVRAEAERARSEAVRQELATREAEAADRAAQTLREAFGEALDDCPSGLLEALRVAETTYQKALYTELHPAAVAVLFAGALERGLYLLLVRPFDQSLDRDRRSAFLTGAVRELRPGRTEYIDRFVEAFDPERKARAPSLGEISRALARRSEAHLAPFGRFLAETFPLGDPALDALAAFVERAKEQLRDPVAHGRALDLPQAELTRFRKELLFELPGSPKGALPSLLHARRR